MNNKIEIIKELEVMTDIRKDNKKYINKILNDNSNQRANNIKENIKRKGNIKNEEIYDRMLNCEIKGKELVLFLNKYNNNLVNNNKK